MSSSPETLEDKGVEEQRILDRFFGQLRDQMVNYFQKAEIIKDPNVAAALQATPRHEFIPLNALFSLAYQNITIPLGEHSSISEPSLVAWMTELLKVETDHKVLEIGTGSGWQAAVLSRLANQVYSLEIDEQLAILASANLQKLGITNVTVIYTDGYNGYPEKAPFDRIIFTTAPLTIPDMVVDQLRDGGILISPVGLLEEQKLIVGTKINGQLAITEVGKVRFHEMQGGPTDPKI